MLSTNWCIPVSLRCISSRSLTVQQFLRSGSLKQPVKFASAVSYSTVPVLPHCPPCSDLIHQMTGFLLLSFVFFFFLFLLFIFFHPVNRHVRTTHVFTQNSLTQHNQYSNKTKIKINGRGRWGENVRR